MERDRGRGRGGREREIEIEIEKERKKEKGEREIKKRAKKSEKERECGQSSRRIHIVSLSQRGDSYQNAARTIMKGYGNKEKKHTARKKAD